MERKHGIDKGVLDPRARRGKFNYARFEPTEALNQHVEHYWSPSWDLRGQPAFHQHTLPYPNVHLVVERGRAEVIGLMSGRFTRIIEGEGRVFGVKFRPGGFASFCPRPIGDFSDQKICVSKFFGLDPIAVADSVFDQPSEEKMALALERVVLGLPQRDVPVSLSTGELVERVRSDRTILRVDQLAELAGVSARTLQRRFERYIGLGPKWVIRRYRLQEAVDALDADCTRDVGDLAYSLGYADQAHFIRDFRDLVGQTPSAYALHGMQ